MRIGILEDDATQVELYRLWFSTAQHECRFFGTISEFIAGAGKERFDLFLLDWVLPDGTAEKALRWLRETVGWEVPVICVTLRDAEQDVVGAHTSEMAEGQVYAPDVNVLMMVAAILLTIYFKASENLAAAYGIAVTGDMFITSVVFFFITRQVWGWSLVKTLPLCLLFWGVDLTFFSACLGKFLTGGWFPLAIAVVILAIMVTWWDGWRRLALKVMTMTISRDQFIEKVAAENPLRLPGTGVFLSTFHKEEPPMLLRYLTQTRALPENLVILSVLTADVPEVEEDKRVETHAHPAAQARKKSRVDRSACG